jgi:hypothetical protein
VWLLTFSKKEELPGWYFDFCIAKRVAVFTEIKKIAAAPSLYKQTILPLLGTKLQWYQQIKLWCLDIY